MQDLKSATETGKALAEVLANENALVIASSDFTHYEPQQSVNKKDNSVLKTIQELDEIQFYSVIESQDVSACGYGPIAALMTFAKVLGVGRAILLSHKTSGDITGDFSSVVGYSSVAFKKM
jgi:AmmeMemoRadiSam system protein B